MKIVVTSSVTLDGVAQAPGRADEDTRGGFSHGGWARPYSDHVMGEVMSRRMAEEGSLLLGRRTYEHLFGTGPNRTEATRSPSARQYPQVRGVEDVAGAASVEKLDAAPGRRRGRRRPPQAQPGPTLGVIGSGELVRSLMRRNLIDEFQLLIHPLALGSGRRLFADDGTAASPPGEQRAHDHGRGDRDLPEGGPMKQYLLSVYQPDGDPPPPAILEQIMRDVERAATQEMKAAGAWVFAGGLHAAEHRHRGARRGRRRADDRRPVRRGQGAPRRLHDHRGAGPRRRARLGPQARPGDHPADRGAAVPEDEQPSWHRSCRHAAVGAREIERVFREEYGRAVAVLVRRLRRHRLAEEAVQDAFAVAVRALAGDRPAAEPGRLDHHHRPQPGDRPAAPRGVARRPARRRPPLLQRPRRAGRRRAPCATTGCA